MDNEFDNDAFNKKFSKMIEDTKSDVQDEEDFRLQQLNNVTNKKLYDQTILEIMINIKNAWFNLLDDIINTNITWSTFTKDNRLFYFGITILFVATILYLYHMISHPHEPPTPAKPE